MSAAFDTRNRYPWTDADIAVLAEAKAKRICHKTIARRLNRTPRAVDQKWAVLNKHRTEELELLERLRAEARMPEILVER